MAKLLSRNKSNDTRHWILFFKSVFLVFFSNINWISFFFPSGHSLEPIVSGEVCGQQWHSGLRSGHPREAFYFIRVNKSFTEMRLGRDFCHESRSFSAERVEGGGFRNKNWLNFCQFLFTKSFSMKECSVISKKKKREKWILRMRKTSSGQKKTAFNRIRFSCER